MAVRKMKDRLLDFFFPRTHCISCEGTEQVRGGVCASCRDKMERYPLEEVCRICGQPSAEREICLACRAEKPPYAAMRAVYVYDGAVRSIIHHMKFRGEYDLPVRLFAEEMAETVRRLEWKADLLVSVPSTPERLRQRGYNQTEVLAKRIGRLLSVPAAGNVLKKKRGTRSQVGLGAEERKRNLRGTILPGRGAKMVRGKSVLLIDDICTTGATAQECSKALLACGAKEVCVLCAARVGQSKLAQYLSGGME